MQKQDRQGVRTAADLERKYDFAGFKEAMGIAKDAQETATKALQAAEEAKNYATSVEIVEVENGIKVTINDKDGGRWFTIPGGTFGQASYRVTNTLTNVTTDNANIVVPDGEKYTATLTPTIGKITAVSVTMGGVDVTDTVYSDGVITIPSVTGNVVITAAAEVVVYSITQNLTSATSSNEAKTITNVEPFYTTIRTTEPTFSVMRVTMGGVDITDGSVTFNTVDGFPVCEVAIPVVTGDIVITAIGVTPSVTYYTVTNQTHNVLTSNPNVSAVKGEAYSATLTPTENASEIDYISVWIGTADMTSTCVRKGPSGSTITIPNVTGDITIIAIAADEITPDEGFCSIKYAVMGVDGFDNTYNQVLHGDPFTIGAYYEGDLKEFSVTMDGVDITNDIMWYEFGAGIIGGEIMSVTGNILITAIATPYEDPIKARIKFLTANVNGNTGDKFVYNGDPYSVTLTSMTAGFKTVSIVMGGEDVTANYISDISVPELFIEIGSVAGEVVITAIA